MLTHTHRDTKQGVDTERPKPTVTDCILHITLTQSLTYTLRVTPTHTLSSAVTQTHSHYSLQSVRSGLFSLITREGIEDAGRRRGLQCDGWGREQAQQAVGKQSVEVKWREDFLKGGKGRQIENRMWCFFSGLRIIIMSLYRRNPCRCYYDNRWKPTVLEYTTAPRLPGGVPGVSVCVCVSLWVDGGRLPQHVVVLIYSKKMDVECGSKLQVISDDPVHVCLYVIYILIHIPKYTNCNVVVCG